MSSLLEYFAQMESLGEWLSGKTIAITGSTGFVGSSISDLIHRIAEVQEIQVTLVTLSRSTQPRPRLNSQVNSLHFTARDQKKFLQTVTQKKIAHIFHLATPTSVERGSSDISNVNFAAVGLLSELIGASRSSVTARLINASSGAIYGPGHREVIDLKSALNREDWGNPIKDTYTAAKRLSEEITGEATSKGYIEGTNARLFAFMGLGLPLTSHFAIGNFLWDSLYNETIRIRGNPNSSRGYLPREILAANLLELMFSNHLLTCHISNYDYRTLFEYAAFFSEISGKHVELIGHPNLPIDFYVGRADERFVTNIHFDLRDYLFNWRIDELRREPN